MMNKRWLAVCMFILVCTSITMPAGAEKQRYVSINDIREEVKDGWHQTYEAHGRTITIDIDITLPDVDAFPIITVTGAPAIPEAMLSNYTVRANQFNEVNIDIGNLSDPIPGVKEAQSKSIDEYTWNNIDWDVVAEDNPLSAADAFAIAKKEIEKFFGSEVSSAVMLDRLEVSGRAYEYFRGKKQYGAAVTPIVNALTGELIGQVLGWEYADPKQWK